MTFIARQPKSSKRKKAEREPYDKVLIVCEGEKGSFERLFDRLETAKTNGARGLVAAKRNDTDNPSTHVHLLVEYLQRIKGSNE